MRLILVALLLTLTACNSFRRAKQKFLSTQVDTTYQTIRQVIPRDSLITMFRTDTSTIRQVIQQGRVQVIYERNPRTTIIRATSDSVIIEKRIPVTVEKQIWGVDPKYRDQFERVANGRNTWRWIAIVAGVVLIGLIALIIFRAVKPPTVL